jgi:anti-sigma factor RsiW
VPARSTSPCGDVGWNTRDDADATFALAYADLTDPTRINRALVELRGAAVGNLGGGVPERAPVQVKGMTSSDEAGRIALAGRLPDGAAVHEHAALFTRGLRVYQATVIGADPPAVVVDTFMAGLKFPG